VGPTAGSSAARPEPVRAQRLSRRPHLHAPKSLGTIALVVLPPVWAYGWIAAKIGVADAPPFTVGALRNLGAALLLLLAAVLTRRPLRPKPLGWLVLLGLLQTTGMVGLSMWALEKGGAGQTSVLAYTMPFWLLLLAWTFLGERIHGLQWAAVACALAGLVAVVSPWRLEGVMSSLLAVGSGLLWAASAVVVKLIRRRSSLNLLALTGWQMLFGALPLAVIALLTSRVGPTWSGSFIASLSYLIVFSEALGWCLWLYVLATLPASTAGIAVLATPVIATLVSWVQLGERPGGLEAVGMGLILLALCVITLHAILARGRRLNMAAVSLVAGAAGGHGDRGMPKDPVDPSRY
jgi:drug/metabolite transporter (DMT)-like permease